MKSNFIKIISGVILSSLILSGCTGGQANKSEDVDVLPEGTEYINYKDVIDEQNSQIEKVKVVVDKDNLSILASLNENNEEDNENSRYISVDTSGSTDLQKGQYLIIQVEVTVENGVGKDSGYKNLTDPMNEDQFNKYLSEQEEKEKLEKEEEQRREEEERLRKEKEDNMIVAEVNGDNRQKEDTKDLDAYLVTSDNKFIFIPTLKQGDYKKICDTVRTNKRVESKEELGNIIGEYSVDVVLTSSGKVVVSTLKDGVYKYYALRVMKNYNIGDKLTIVEGDAGKQSFLIIED